MIIKIDHITLASLDFDKDIPFLENLGFKPVFIEKDVKNLEIKRKITQKFPALHDLSLLNANCGMNIELINHHNINNKGYCMVPVISNLTKGIRQNSPASHFNLNGCASFMEGMLDNFNAPVYILDDTPTDELCVKGAVIKVADLIKSMEFWELLGFKKISASENYCALKFASHFQKSEFILYLIEEKDYEGNFFLDSPGFKCLAFVTNSAQSEMENFNKQGFSTTATEAILINNRKLQVFFVFGPSKEVVEFISLK